MKIGFAYIYIDSVAISDEKTVMIIIMKK